MIEDFELHGKKDLFYIIDKPSVPINYSYPELNKYIIFSFITGVFLSFLAIFLRIMFNEFRNELVAPRGFEPRLPE